MRKRLESLGYTLQRNQKDSLGKTHKYRTVPMGSGPINYFDSVADLKKYCEQVEFIRS